MKNNEKKEKNYRLFDKTTNLWFEVSSEDYWAYNREIRAIRLKMLDYGRCSCPKKSFWLCDGCCQGCEFENNIVSSLDEPSIKMVCMNFVLDEESNTEELVINDIIFESLIKRLNELMPEALEILELRLLGITDEEIGHILGIKNTTFRARLDNVKSILKSEFGDVFPF